MAKCLRCKKPDGLTRSHVPMKFVGRWAFGSLKKAFKGGRLQIYWLCEECRRQHQTLETELVKRRMLELAQELKELHRKFCESPTKNIGT